MPDIDWPSRARELAADFASRARDHDREASFPFENFDALHDAGFLKLVVPARYGGYEVPLATFLRTQEEFGAGDSATALGLNMHQVRFGSEREAGSYPERWFAEMCRGAVEHGWLSNTAATEEGLGSPAGGGLPETTALEVEGGWLINGRKTFTTMAPALEFLILLARIGDDDDNPEIGTFMLRRGDPGMRVDETWDSLGMRASGSHDLVLEDMRIPAGRLMGRRVPGQPDPRGASGQVWFALGVAATTIGIALGARDYAVSYARTSAPGGKTAIREFPGVRSRVARIDILVQRSRALVYDAAAAWEQQRQDGMPSIDRVAVAKTETLNACIEAVDQAMRIVGGVSLQKSRPIERFYRDVRAGLHNPPLEDRAIEQLARRALDGEETPPRAVE